VLMTAKYTDKSDLAPDNYLTSVIYDFSVMLDEILTKVQDGTTGGYLGMDYDKGISLQEPANVDKAVADQVDKAVEDLKSGAIEVERDVTPVG
jgi:basic membrane protein A